MNVHSNAFGVLPSGESVDVYTLDSGTGFVVRLLTYGGIIASLHVPDRHGNSADVVLGHDDLEGYLTRSHYFGALIGRVANRIAHGHFVLDGVSYQLACNNGPHHLHGGLRGFDKVVWEATPFEAHDHVGVALSYISPDGEEGYPGTLHVRATFTLTHPQTLTIAYEATTDQSAPVNLTHHSYFNLAGHTHGDVRDHLLQIHAAGFTPTDATLIPTGDIIPVAGTPVDLRTPTHLRLRLNTGDPLLDDGGGFDHNFVLDTEDLTKPDAWLHDPDSGRFLAVYTSEPCLQCYTGSGLTGMRGKAGATYAPFAGLCLEPQHPPDALNQPAFPSIVLQQGTTYRSATRYVFNAVP